jgi:hypothetical protein
MFRVYGTYSDGSSYRRLAIGSFNGTEFDIQTEGAGTGAAAGPLNFGTVGVRRMTIGTTGNVGIGTTAPTSVLHVQGTCRINPYTSSVNSGVVIDDTGGGGSPALRGFSSGTFGITAGLEVRNRLNSLFKNCRTELAKDCAMAIMRSSP